MARGHGSAQGCYLGERPDTGSCEACREYSRMKAIIADYRRSNGIPTNPRGRPHGRPDIDTADWMDRGWDKTIGLLS